MSDSNGKVKLRRTLLYLVLGLLVLLVCTSFYGAFVIAPQERREIRDTAENLEDEEQKRAKFMAGVTALFCTAQNRHDAISTEIINVVLPGAEARDEESGTNLAQGFHDALDKIPPPTNCGELICQLFRETNEPEAEITIQDPFGPNRKLAPCGEAPA